MKREIPCPCCGHTMVIHSETSPVIGAVASGSCTHCILETNRTSGPTESQALAFVVEALERRPQNDHLTTANARIKELESEVTRLEERHLSDVYWVRGQRKMNKDLAEKWHACIRDIAAIDKTRAGKLLRKQKPFIVIAHDEPYYLDVYATIREHEQAKGTWTEECERQYQEAVAATNSEPSEV